MKRNHDGKQFHQYQQNQQSPLTSLNIKKTMTLEMKVLAWAGTKMWQDQIF